MTDRIAAIVAFLIAAVFVVDAIWYQGAFTIFLGKKLLDATEYLAFWR